MPIPSPFAIVQEYNTLERLQRAVYLALTADQRISELVTGVYDAVPQDTAFPYITTASDNIDQWDADDMRGFEATLEIHVWSRHRGQGEVKRIQQAIYNALHNVALTVIRHNTVLCQWETAQQFVDPDGLTRHGVQSFRVILNQS